MTGRPDLGGVGVRDHVALLGRGRHAHPRRGGCLLELVGTLDGGPWSDRPRAVPPALAALGRTMNDSTAASMRPALAPLVPFLARAGGGRGVGDRDIVTDVVVRHLGAHRLTAALPRSVPGRAGQDRRARRAEKALSRAVREAAGGMGDRSAHIWLYDLLVDALVTVGGSADHAPRYRAPARCLGTVPVLSNLRWADCEVWTTFAVADRDHWPDWLQEPMPSRALAPVPGGSRGPGDPGPDPRSP